MRIRKNDRVVLLKAITGAKQLDGRAIGKEEAGSVARVLKVIPDYGPGHRRGRQRDQKVLERVIQQRRAIGLADRIGVLLARRARVSVKLLLTFHSSCA